MEAPKTVEEILTATRYFPEQPETVAAKLALKKMVLERLPGLLSTRDKETFGDGYDLGWNTYNEQVKSIIEEIFQ